MPTKNFWSWQNCNLATMTPRVDDRKTRRTAVEISVKSMVGQSPFSPCRDTHLVNKKSFKQMYWCQFHQHFTYEFFVQIFWQSQNVTRKMTFVRKICLFNVNEIDGRCQFHQHFTSSFCARKSQKRKKTLMTWLSFYICGICASKKLHVNMLVRSTLDVNFINILPKHF